MSTDEEDWFDVTAVASEYEVQTSYSGKWRHRLRILPFRPSRRGIDWNRFGSDSGDPWIDGPPPTLTADPQ